jgi:hypothetical protein
MGRTRQGVRRSAVGLVDPAQSALLLLFFRFRPFFDDFLPDPPIILLPRPSSFAPSQEPTSLPPFPFPPL